REAPEPDDGVGQLVGSIQKPMRRGSRIAMALDGVLGERSTPDPRYSPEPGVWLFGLLAESQLLRAHQPEIHAHGSKLDPCVAECCPGLRPSPRGTMEGCQAEVTAGLERLHLERPGQGERFLVALTRRVGCGGLPSRGHLRLRAQCPRLVPTLATL